MTLFSNVNWLPLFALTCTSFSPFFHHSLRHLAQAKKLRPPSDGLSVSPLKWQLSNCRNWVTQLFDFSAIKYILFKKKVTHYCCFLSLLVPYMWAEPLRWRSKVWNGVMYWVSLVRFLVFFSRSCSRSRKEEEYKEWFWLCVQEYTFLRSVSISNCPTFFNVWRIFCNSICFNPMFKATSTYNGAIMCQCVQTHVQCKTCNNEYIEKDNYKYNLYSWMCTNVKGKKHPWNFSRRH